MYIYIYIYIYTHTHTHTHTHTYVSTLQSGLLARKCFLFATSPFPADQYQPERGKLKIKKIESKRAISTTIFRSRKSELTDLKYLK